MNPDVVVQHNDKTYNFKYAKTKSSKNISFNDMPLDECTIPCLHYPIGDVRYALMHLAIVTKNHTALDDLMREFFSDRDAPCMWVVVRLCCQYGDMKTLLFVLNRCHYNYHYNDNHAIIKIGEIRNCCRYNFHRTDILKMFAEFDDSDYVYVETINPAKPPIDNSIEAYDDDDAVECLCIYSHDITFVKCLFPLAYETSKSK